MAAAQVDGQLDVAPVDGLETKADGTEPHLVAEGQRGRGHAQLVDVDAVLALEVAHLDRIVGRVQDGVLPRDFRDGQDDVVEGGTAHGHVSRRQHERAEGVADLPLEP